MAADTLDVIALAAAKLAINMKADNTDHDSKLEQQVTAISRRMDELVGPVVNRSLTEYHDGGSTCLVPRRTPVDSIGTLTEADGTSTTVLTAESFGTIPSDAYLLDQDERYPHDCEIRRRDQGADAYFPGGRRNVKLEYTAGRAANTAAVDRRFVECAAEILRRLWKRESGVWAQSSSILEQLAADGADATPSPGFFKVVDPRIKEMLGDQMYPPGVG